MYGLGANALDAAAVGRIFEVKGRPHSSPLIVHVASVAMARELALEWPPAADALARHFWPGPLTIVVPKNGLASRTSRPPDLPSVGLRMPAHPMALALLEACGLPLAAPSANRFTQLSPTTAQHVREGLGDAVDLVLDGGPCTVGIESTVISLTGHTPRILRPGIITQAQIEEIIGPVEVGAGAESPGQHPKHYSPRTASCSAIPPPQAEVFASIEPTCRTTPPRMPSGSTGFSTTLTSRATTGSRSSLRPTRRIGPVLATGCSAAAK